MASKSRASRPAASAPAAAVGLASPSPPPPSMSSLRQKRRRQAMEMATLQAQEATWQGRQCFCYRGTSFLFCINCEVMRR